MNKHRGSTSALLQEDLERTKSQRWDSEKRHSDIVPAISDDVDLDTLLQRLTVAANPYRILSLLRALDKVLSVQFEEEESADGLHADIGRWAPQFYPSIDRRRSEHRDILARIGELEGTVDPLALRQGVAALVLDVQLHELRESDMMLDAAIPDFGAGI